jgi:glycerophosphoryl diester phosphodiesterase
VGTPGKPLLLGHRGCRGAFPENTLTAFGYALTSGCDGFEFDVRRTKDGVGLICHNREILFDTISQTTYKELLTLPLRYKQHHFTPAVPIEICCLETVLERFADRAFLDIELKDVGLERHAIELCRRHPDARVVISSFLPEVIREVHYLAPEISVGFIFDTGDGCKVWPKLPVTHVFPQFRLLKKSLIEDMHAAGKKVMTWTVNRDKTMRQLAEWGIDGIISDDPVSLSNTLGSNDRLTT